MWLLKTYLGYTWTVSERLLNYFLFSPIQLRPSLLLSFPVEDAAKILRIPLALAPHNNFLTWGPKLRANPRYVAPTNYYKFLIELLELMLYWPFIAIFTKKNLATKSTSKNKVYNLETFMELSAYKN